MLFVAPTSSFTVRISSSISDSPRSESVGISDRSDISESSEACLARDLLCAGLLETVLGFIGLKSSSSKSVAVASSS